MFHRRFANATRVLLCTSKRLTPQSLECRFVLIHTKTWQASDLHGNSHLKPILKYLKLPLVSNELKKDPWGCILFEDLYICIYKFKCFSLMTDEWEVRLYAMIKFPFCSSKWVSLSLTHGACAKASYSIPAQKSVAVSPDPNVVKRLLNHTHSQKLYTKCVPYDQTWSQSESAA